MKYIILVGDGMADHPQEKLGGKTPVEYAKTPNIDSIAKTGIVSSVSTVPEDMHPGSDVANMSLLGYDPAKYYTGRAPIEAAGMNIKLNENDTAFRCNLVSLSDGKMADYSCGGIENEDAEKLISSIQKELNTGRVRFHTGVSYRHLLVITDFPEGSLNTTPPHDISGRKYQDYLPSGSGEDILKDLFEKAGKILSSNPVNEKRVAANKIPATNIWLWGQGKASQLPAITKRYGISGAVISAVNLVKGLGILAGLDSIDVEGATGYIDTNYQGKVDAAAEALEKSDFVYLHVEAPDETSHEGSLEKKLTAISDFDKNVVGPVLKFREQYKDLRILVTPDHPTLLSTMTHHREAVPFTVSGKGIEPDDNEAYSEKNGRNSGKVYTGESMFENLIRGDF